MKDRILRPGRLIFLSASKSGASVGTRWLDSNVMSAFRPATSSRVASRLILGALGGERRLRKEKEASSPSSARLEPRERGAGSRDSSVCSTKEKEPLDHKQDTHRNEAQRVAAHGQHSAEAGAEKAATTSVEEPPEMPTRADADKSPDRHAAAIRGAPQDVDSHAGQPVAGRSEEAATATPPRQRDLKPLRNLGGGVYVPPGRRKQSQ
jgi:hypothetical protein